MIRPTHEQERLRSEAFQKKYMLVITRCPLGHKSLASVERATFKPGVVIDSECLELPKGAEEVCTLNRILVSPVEYT